MSSVQNPPPSYAEYSNYSNQPPQTVPIQQQFPQPLPPQPVPQITVISQQPTSVTVRTIPILGPIPISITCSQCYAFVTTITNHEISARTHCCALALCLTGLWCFAPLPYICGGCCKKTVHRCPNCNAFIGTY
ncbi:hypothetical protein PVAND_006439 [Polypedilum vanderplanki]|uniref:LITAF domain-containing protein n=1 Tax=Polypedilum vanderplanki TaxID=319348 RepID=A0A9J6C468_POLVA|nr:hypothetical protein PVAND_006439 [Polypedilum vanderplanki]